MKLVKPLIIAGLMLGTASMAHAQDIVGTAKDVVTDKATDVVKDKGADLAKSAVGTLSTEDKVDIGKKVCLLYTSPSPRDLSTSRMPSSA